MANPKLVSKTTIYRDMTSLMNDVLDITVQFPKAYKFTVGNRMHELAINCLQDIAKAYITKDISVRIGWLVQMQSDFEVLKTLIRTAAERGWIKGRGKQGHLVELVVNVGKQSSAWKGSLVSVTKDSEVKPEPQG